IGCTKAPDRFKRGLQVLRQRVSLSLTGCKTYGAHQAAGCHLEREMGIPIQLFRPTCSCYDGAASKEATGPEASGGNAHHPTRSSRLMSAVLPSASYSSTVRLSITNRPGMLGRVAMAIGDAGGDIGAVDLVESGRERILRDITIKARDSVHGQQIVNRLKSAAGVRIINISDRTFLMHLGGKIEIHNKAPIRTRDDLSMAYTPGVARVCLAIRDDRQRA